MDDPIFDPWSIGQPDPDPTRTPTQRTPRWRSVVGGQGVPLSRPVLASSPKRPTIDSASSGYAAFLHALLIPQLTGLIQRLEMARHETTVDDRLDQPTPSLRFRLRPRQGPFDEGCAEDGAVLEILVDEGPAPHVTGRLWLNPLSALPSEQRRVEAAKLTDTWVNRLLLDFVEKALRRG